MLEQHLIFFFLFFPFLQRKGWSDANNGKIHHHIRYCGGSLPPNLLRRIQNWLLRLQNFWLLFIYFIFWFVARKIVLHFTLEFQRCWPMNEVHLLKVSPISICQVKVIIITVSKESKHEFHLVLQDPWVILDYNWD